MSWYTVKIDAADRLFSKYIRLKYGKCQNCGKWGGGDDRTQGLQASHYHSRKKESVRYDESNVDCFCVSCHRELGTNNRKAYDEYKLKQLGEVEYNKLLIRANTTQKKDRKMALIMVKELMKTL